METYTINIGGSEVFYFDMYIPPQTSYKYDVRIYAPHSASMFGEFLKSYHRKYKLFTFLSKAFYILHLVCK